MRNQPLSESGRRVLPRRIERGWLRGTCPGQEVPLLGYVGPRVLLGPIGKVPSALNLRAEAGSFPEQSGTRKDIGFEALRHCLHSCRGESSTAPTSSRRRPSVVDPGNRIRFSEG